MSYLGKGPGKIFMPPPGGSINWSQLDPATQLQLQSMFSGRNRLDNGDARVIQHISGFSATAGTAGYGAADRWKINNQLAAGTIYMSQTTLVDQNGITKSCVFQRCDAIATTPTGANYHSGIYQIIEGVNVYDLIGKPVSLSFIFKANVSGIFSVSVRDGGNMFSYVNSFTYATANVPQYVSFTLPPIPMSAGIAISSGTGIVLNVGPIAGTSQWVAPSAGSWLAGTYFATSNSTNWANATTNQINIADVQFEEGLVATPFERLPYQVQLARCQRYYNYWSSLLVGGAYCAANNSIFSTFTFPVQMRVAPTVTYNSINYLNGSGLATNTVSTGYLRAAVTATAAGNCYSTSDATFSADM